MSDKEAIDPNDHEMNRREFTAKASLLGVTSAAVMTAGCSGQENGGNGGGNGGSGGFDDEDYQEGGWVRVGSPDTFDSMDPHLATVQWEFIALRKITETLFRINETMDFVPHLAQDVEFERGGARWVMPLEDAEFHEPIDRPFVADDVVATWDRLTNPDFGSPRSDNFTPLTDYGAVDENTVYAEFGDEPYAAFRGSMEERGGAILPREQATTERIREPVGTGPFVFDEFIEREGIFAEKNPDYWYRDVAPDGLAVIPRSEPSVRVTEIQNGELHVDQVPSLDFIDQYQQHEDVRVQVADTQSGRNQLAINASDDVLEDRPENPPVLTSEVRHAINNAVDRSLHMELVHGEFGTPNQGVYPPEFPWQEDYTPWPDAENDEARQLLDEAGFDEPEVEIITRSGQEEELAHSEILQDTIQNIGFDVNNNLMEVGPWLDRLEAGRFDIRPGIGNFSADPIIFDQGRYMSRDSPQHYFGGPDNNADQVGELFDEAAVTADEQERAELYQEGFNILIDDSTYLVTGHHDTVQAFHKSASEVPTYPNFTWNDYDTIRFADPEEAPDPR